MTDTYTISGETRLAPGFVRLTLTDGRLWFPRISDITSFASRRDGEGTVLSVVNANADIGDGFGMVAVTEAPDVVARRIGSRQ
jgi:hypothetical protein